MEHDATPELAQMRALADPAHAAKIAAQHKSGRETLGLRPAQIDALVADWRAARDVEGRVALARALWDADIHEARLAAGKLLTQARIQPDEAVWALIGEWVPQIDGAAIADAVSAAGQRRLTPERLSGMLAWADSRNPWVRRSLLTMTQPLAKMPHPKPEDLEMREEVLEAAGTLADVAHGAVQQALGAWLRDLARRDPERAEAFAAEHELKPVARRAAGLPDQAPDQAPDAER